MCTRGSRSFTKGSSKPFGEQGRAATTEAAERDEQTRIVSRYGVAREVEALTRVLAQMRWEDRRLVEQVTIDSKATWLVQVALREWDADDAKRVANSVEAGMLAEVGGHNGIAVIAPSNQVFVPGCWGPGVSGETRISYIRCEQWGIIDWRRRVAHGVAPGRRQDRGSLFPPGRWPVTTAGCRASRDGNLGCSGHLKNIIAQCLNLEREFHHTASKLCILGFEPLK